MKRLLLGVVDHPVLAGGLVVLLTVFFALQIRGLEVDTSTESLMAEHDPARQYYERIKRKFGSDALTVVLVKADDVFTAPVLGVVRKLSDALERIDGVTRVESLTTVRQIRGGDDFLDTAPLVGADIPVVPAELQRIRAAALGNRVFVGNLVARDARATAVVVYTDARSAGGRRFNERFTERVEALIRDVAVPGVTLYQVGEPLTKATYGAYIRQDQLTLIPVSVAVLFVVLFVALRSGQGVVIPLVTASLSIVWALGLMRLAGLPLNAMTVAIPSLLLAIGFTEDVHMLTAYYGLLEQGHDRLAAVRSMVGETALPILVTSATTVLGFLSLATTDITLLIQFGYAAALGLVANYVVTVVVLPIVLRAWPPPRRPAPVPAGDAASRDPIPRLMERLVVFNLRHRFTILAVAALLTAGSLVGWYMLRADTDFINYFPADSPLRQRFDDLHASLGGPMTFYVVVESGREDGMKDPDLLRRVAGLQAFLAGTGQVDTTVSVADYLMQMHREMNGGGPRFEVIPDSADQVAQYLLTLEGKELAKYLDFDASTANVVVRHNLSGSWALSALLGRLDAHVAQAFPPSVRVRHTGEAILVNNAADYWAVNQVTSFSYTLLIIGLVHALLFMSVRAGFLSLIPNVVPILYTYGLMGLLGVPLNTGTAMVATIAIGIAVDDTVHHMVTYGRQLNQHHDQQIAMVNTMKAQGRPIIYVSLALACGFLVLGFSSFVPTVQVGVFSAVAMLIAMVGELVLTPIVMHSTRLTTLWDMVLLRMNPELVRTAPLLRGLSRWEARKVILMGVLRSLRAGEFVIHKGEARTELYMLVTGRVRVFDVGAYGGERTLAVLDPGSVFGEIGLVGGGARTANVVAESPCEVLQLDLEALERLRKRFPFTAAKLFRNLARVLAERLRDRTADLMREAAPSVLPVVGPAATGAPREGSGP